MEKLIDVVNPLQDVLFVILLFKDDNFTRAPYDIDILGKKMWEWVALCGSGAKIKTIPCTNQTDIIGLVKPLVNDEKYTFILYSDTPLITRNDVLEILDYFKAKSLSVLKLKRGFVFESEYLKNCESILCDFNPIFDGNEFDKIDSFKKLENVRRILQGKILDYHLSNGVNIIDTNRVNIDADVVIEKGVVIYPNNFIFGQSYIGENATLEPNNVIFNSIISSGAVLKGAYVQNSRLDENKIIGPYDKIIDKNI